MDATYTSRSDFFPFKCSVPFARATTRIKFRETLIKPLHCKTSDTEYVSGQQCFVNMFADENYSPCPIKCLPIQMKGFQYVNKSTSLTNCAKLEDETCNAGSRVWNKLYEEFPNCLKPCKKITYKDSKLDIYEPMFLEIGQNLANFDLMMNSLRKIEKEALVYDTNDVIGAIGGSLGLFLGFSFFDVISKCLDLIMRLVNYLVALK